jgi:hypothetical protein
MNTRFTYTYRDANNYKNVGEAVVAGEITAAQRQQIDMALDDGEFFVPIQVGLPDCSEISRGYMPCEADHAWTELDVHEIETTEDAPSVAGDIDTVVAAFAAHAGKWDLTTPYLPSDEEMSGMRLVEDLDEEEISHGGFTVWALAIHFPTAIQRRAWGDRASLLRERRRTLDRPAQSIWLEAYTPIGWQAACRAWRERGYQPPEIAPLTVAEPASLGR